MLEVKSVSGFKGRKAVSSRGMSLGVSVRFCVFIEVTVWGVLGLTWP